VRAVQQERQALEPLRVSQHLQELVEQDNQVLLADQQQQVQAR
jgi:hypothetical protein